jgi:hypothetical protein
MGKILPTYCDRITQYRIMSVLAMNQQDFQALTNEGDVISVQDNMHSYIHNYPMFKLSDVMQQVSCKLLSINQTQWNSNVLQKKWLTDGVNCEVMKVGEGKWKKGKVRIKLVVEFCPDEPSASQSPLDDLR